MADDYDEKYTDPDLRREIKDELMDSDKGGDPGQWSARKSQMLVQEYEKRGGGYKKDAKDEDAKSLEEWTDQDWQTKDGSAYASEDGETKRYLPKRAWDLLSDAEKDRTDRKKRDEGDDAATAVRRQHRRGQGRPRLRRPRRRERAVRGPIEAAQQGRVGRPRLRRRRSTAAPR